MPRSLYPLTFPYCVSATAMFVISSKQNLLILTFRHGILWNHG